MLDSIFKAAKTLILKKNMLTDLMKKNSIFSPFSPYISRVIQTFSGIQ